ncbi:MAG: hypothetical protein CME71_07400 [Halobacteriovorax sp.]|nr:hypothetical protein [Halobacteriovorax sp.]
MNKTIKLFAILAGLISASSAWAQFSVINAAGSGASGTGSGSTVRSAGEPEPGVTALPSQRVTCQTEKRVGLQMLRNLMVAPNDYNISITEGERRKLKVQIPAHYGDCLNLRFEYKIVSNDVLVSAHNDLSYTEYAQCLKDKGILSADGTQFDASKASITEASFEFVDLPEFDAEKNVEAFFMSPNPNPNNGNYGAAFPSGWLASSDACSKKESLQEGGAVVYLSPENEAADRAFRACNSLDYEAILRELERLDSSTLGNASVLKTVLQGALDSARKQRATEIFSRFTEIEAMFKPSADDIAAGRNVGVGEDEAIRLSNEYATLLTELNEVVIDPSIKEIDALVKEHGQTTSRGRQSEIQDRLKELNTSVGEYAKRSGTGLRDLYKGLQEFALIDQAEKIEGFRLKSEAFSRVYVGRADGRRGEQISVERANKFITDRMETFMTQVVVDWDDSYRVRNLDRAPLQSSQRRVSQAYERLNRNWERYQKSEQEQMRRYCGSNFLGQMKNPVRCQQFQRGAEGRRRRAMSGRERDLKNLRRRGEHYSSLSNQYSSAVDRFEAQNQSSYDDMGIYSNYGDDYSYLYGSNYDSGYSNFDMGSMTMGMGNNMGSLRGPASGGQQQMMSYSPMMGQNPYGMSQQQMMYQQPGMMMPGQQMQFPQTGGMMQQGQGGMSPYYMMGR